MEGGDICQLAFVFDVDFFDKLKQLQKFQIEFNLLKILVRVFPPVDVYEYLL